MPKKFRIMETRQRVDDKKFGERPLTSARSRSVSKTHKRRQNRNLHSITIKPHQKIRKRSETPIVKTPTQRGNFWGKSGRVRKPADPVEAA